MKKKMQADGPLMIAGRAFGSRLLLGTGKFSSARVMKSALNASGTEIVTVALRRVELDNARDSILSAVDVSRYLLLPNTSGARNAEEAVRLARLARAAGCEPWIKLEITPDPHYLLPDPIETLKAAEILVREGFTVLPYINADPVLAKRLEEAGTATVMPLGSPIGSNRGVKTRELIEIIIEKANVPVVVDAGLGGAVACRRGNGDGGRCGAGQYGGGRGRGSDSHGPGVQKRGGSGTRSLPGRPRQPAKNGRSVQSPYRIFEVKP